MKLLHRGLYEDGSLLPMAIVTRVWSVYPGGRFEAFILMLPIPIYRAGYDKWEPMRDAFEGWFFPTWRFMSESDGRKETCFLWREWKITRWASGRNRRG